MKEETQLRSRTAYAMQNFACSMMGTLVKALLAFASQTVFIYTLGSVYLGVNGLFTNILGMLSLAELGIGGAISFSLYKPLAEHDTKKIQHIINFYRSAYRMVAVSVTVVGVAITLEIPELAKKYLVKPNFISVIKRFVPVNIKRRIKHISKRLIK